MKSEFKIYKKGKTSGMVTILSGKGMPFDRESKIKMYLSLGYQVFELNGTEIK